MRLAGPVIALVGLVFALVPASAGATSECTNLADMAGDQGRGPWGGMFLVEGGSTAEFGGDQPPTKAQLDAVEVTNHIHGDELVTKTEVGADAAGASVELQQDIVCK